MLAAGLDLVQTRLAGQLDLVAQRLGIQMLRHIKVDVFVLLRGVDNMGLGGDVVLLAEMVERGGGELAALHRNIPLDVKIIRVGIQQLFQPLLQSHFHGLPPIVFVKSQNPTYDGYYTRSFQFC